MAEVTGSVVGVKFNVAIPKANGAGTFTGNQLKIAASDGSSQVFNIAAATAAGKFMQKLNLSPGDTVTVVTGGKFNNVTKVVKGRGAPSGATGARKSAVKYKDNTEGMIKGNTVSNAVALAIHNCNNRRVTLNDLVAASEIVLDLHSHLEGQSIKERVSSAPARAKESISFDEEESAPNMGLSEDEEIF